MTVSRFHKITGSQLIFATSTQSPLAIASNEGGQTPSSHRLLRVLMTTGSSSSTANCSVAFRSSATVGSCSSLDPSPQQREAGTAHNNVICVVTPQNCQIFLDFDFRRKADHPWSFWTQNGVTVDVSCIRNWWCVSCQMKEAQPTLLPLWLTDELGKQKDIKPISWCKRHLLEQISGAPSLSRRWAQMQSSSYLCHQSRHSTRTKSLKEGTAVATKSERQSQFCCWNPARCIETGTGRSGCQLMTQILEFLHFFFRVKVFCSAPPTEPREFCMSCFWSPSVERKLLQGHILSIKAWLWHPWRTSFSFFKVFATSFLSNGTVHVWPSASCFRELFFTKGG